MTTQDQNNNIPSTNSTKNNTVENKVLSNIDNTAQDRTSQSAKETNTTSASSNINQVSSNSIQNSSNTSTNYSNISQPSFSDPIQGALYSVLNHISGRYFGQNNVPTQFLMVATIYLAPQITQIADNVLVDAKSAMYLIQMSVFTNINAIESASQYSENIISNNSGFIINLSFLSHQTPLADNYRATLGTSAQNRVILFNVVSGSVCIRVPYMNSTVSGDTGSTKQYGSLSLQVGNGFAVVKDYLRNLKYAFNYTNDQLTQVVYTDNKNGYQVTCTSVIGQVPVIEQIPAITTQSSQTNMKPASN